MTCEWSKMCPASMADFLRLCPIIVSFISPDKDQVEGRPPLPCLCYGLAKTVDSMAPHLALGCSRLLATVECNDVIDSCESTRIRINEISNSKMNMETLCFHHCKRTLNPRAHWCSQEHYSPVHDMQYSTGQLNWTHAAFCFDARHCVQLKPDIIYSTVLRN